MVEKLDAVYRKASLCSRTYLLKKLLSLKYNENKNLQQHFQIFESTAREVKQSGLKLDDVSIVCFLLLSMPESYEVVVTVLENLPQDDITLDNVKNRLLEF